MSADKALKPISITSHPASYVMGGFMLLAGPFIIWLALQDGITASAVGCALVALLDICLGLFLLISPQLRRITVSTEGVTITDKRARIHAELPWEAYRFVYRLNGYKVAYLLFSPEALTKQAQYEAHTACLGAREIPFVCGGCLSLPGQMYYPQILRRLPEHIRVMPEYECGTLWNKGKG